MGCRLSGLIASLTALLLCLVAATPAMAGQVTYSTKPLTSGREEGIHVGVSVPDYFPEPEIHNAEYGSFFMNPVWVAVTLPTRDAAGNRVSSWVATSYFWSENHKVTLQAGKTYWFFTVYWVGGDTVIGINSSEPELWDDGDVFGDGGGMRVTWTIGYASDSAPVISGATDRTITVGDAFNVMDGVTARDDHDGDLTSSIKASPGRVDTSRPGTTTITYTVSDSGGHTTTARRRITVKAPDATPPVIEGADDVTIPVGGGFDPLDGVTATDETDGDVSSSLKADPSTVDASRPGTVEVTITAEDKSGNKATVKRVVTIVAVMSSLPSTGADPPSWTPAVILACGALIPYEGCIPEGGRCEDPPADGLRARWPRLRETPSTDYRTRTGRNVLLADMVLLLTPDGTASTPGTRLTAGLARRHARPLHTLPADDARQVGELIHGLPDGARLMIAGPRESKAPGITRTALRTLDEAFRGMRDGEAGETRG